MSDDRQSPDNGGPDQGPPDSALPADGETSKKSAMPRMAFDDGALKVMEDEFQVKSQSIQGYQIH
jgi:hypothetical protein